MADGFDPAAAEALLNEAKDSEEPLVKRLRKTLDSALADNKTFRTERRDGVLRDVGIDPNSWIGRQVANDYSGPWTADDLRKYAEAEGIPVTANDGSEAADGGQPDPVAEQRTQATQNIAQLRGQAQPVGQQKMDYDSYTKLKLANPIEANRALLKGQVELPPHLAQAIEAGRREDAGLVISD